MNDDEYARLFNARGRKYDAAMMRHPHVRDAEFDTAVAIAGVQAGDTVADIPCGGGYLARHLPAGVTLYSVDSSDVFADCIRAGNEQRFLACPITAVPLSDGVLDHVLSIAGLHHVAERRPFWRECARLLRCDGVLTVGDVEEGSTIARFLDGVVDRHTPTGHRGSYFNADTAAELEQCGFRVEAVESRRIAWQADDLPTLAGFCRLLFGLEGIGIAELAAVLVDEIGVVETAGGVELDWGLVFYRARRTASAG